MTTLEFTEWCAFFRQQLMRDEDPEFLDEWIRELSVASLEEAKEAVLYCARTATRFDVPKKMLPKILAFLREKRDRAAALKNRARYVYADALVGDDWLKSEQRKKMMRILRQ